MDKLKTSAMDDFGSATCHSRGDMVEVYENETRVVWLNPNQRSASGKKVANIFVENSKKIAMKQLKTKVSWQRTAHGTYQRKLVIDDKALETKTGDLAVASKDSNCCGDAGFLSDKNLDNKMQKKV
ncbi:uncharacterized protein LOC111066305 [Drosophila obscura]|uniref:uncharacterized protein LOC111066305 n=1 Tax=Drosophila obscura TaxID=7282 RepID=UPI001BB2C589|nr:uncharacterized protein LOC111066305 [Drosophila obscura]